MTLSLQNVRGTAAGGSVSVEQVPVQWVDVDGGEALEVGRMVRLVDCRPTEGLPIMRVDKMMTAVWTVPAQVQDGGVKVGIPN